MVNVNPIRTQRDHEAALRAVEGLMDAKPGTAAGDRLEILVTLIQAYEANHHAIDAADPIALIRFACEQRGLRQADLAGILGCSSGRVSEVMNRRRPLTLAMIRRLAAKLDLPAEALVRPYPLSKTASRAA